MPGFTAALLLIALAQTPPPDQGPVIPKAPDAETVLAQAVKLHEAGDIIGAITNYEAYLKSDPNNPGVRSNLGAAYVRMGRLAEGIEEYRKALAIEPANPTFRFNLALALYKGGRYPEAVTELQGVLKGQTDHLGARLLHFGVLLDELAHQAVQGNGLQLNLAPAEAGVRQQILDQAIHLARVAHDAFEHHRIAHDPDIARAHAQRQAFGRRGRLHLLDQALKHRPQRERAQLRAHHAGVEPRHVE